MNLSAILCLNIVFLLIVITNAGIPGRIPILMARGEHSYVPDLSHIQTDEWICRFERDFCNLKNQYNMAPFQRLSDHRFPIFGEMSMLYINVSNAGNYQAARLESDYFDTKSYSTACLSLTYLMYGTGAVKLYLIQQDVQNKCIWIDNNESIDNYGNWRQTKLTIDLRDGNPRFFIEAHIDVRPPNYGTVAISRLAFTYGSCDYDDTNYCNASGEQPIQKIPDPVK